MCKKYKSIFHSDGSQSLGYYKYNFKKSNINFFVGSGHKFHGPKGIGIIYINKKFIALRFQLLFYYFHIFRIHDCNHRHHQHL